MRTYPTVLSIAGSDSSGGAGIQADLKTCSALGVYGMTAITAITAQNTMGVTGIEGISPSIVKAQIEAVFSDIRPDAVKIGMLFSKDIIIEVTKCLKSYAPKYIVLDPVMISTSGSHLISDDAIAVMISEMLPIATIVTPNKYEAELISGITIHSVHDIEIAANKILSMGANSVLIKGGHFDKETMTDYLFIAEEKPITFEARAIDTKNTHGTGCTLSTAIASYLALGLPLTKAVGKAKAYLTNALIAGSMNNIGSGHGPMNHLFSPEPMHININ
ncbi:MAG: bifunctional hydroxymethylpyrimidine kinase/phosphomethylpyrimidine kinase [Muribaculaceae bacterium]